MSAPKTTVYDTTVANPKDMFSFYKAILQDKGYNVTNKILSVNNYEKASFQQFLWLLETAELSTCYYDEGGYQDFLKWRAEKLWVQIDGIYWEVRK